MVIQITARLSVPDSAVREVFVRAGGPGGQNVNKVATAVQLFVDLRLCGFSGPMLARIAVLAGRRLTKEGVLVLTAQKQRTQELNRAEAMTRVLDLLRTAAKPMKVRRETRPTYGSEVRRREGKQQKARRKAGRQRVVSDSSAGD